MWRCLGRELLSPSASFGLRLFGSLPRLRLSNTMGMSKGAIPFDSPDYSKLLLEGQAGENNGYLGLVWLAMFF